MYSEQIVHACTARNIRYTHGVTPICEKKFNTFAWRELGKCVKGPVYAENTGAPIPGKVREVVEWCILAKYREVTQTEPLFSNPPQIFILSPWWSFLQPKQRIATELLKNKAKN